MKDKQIKDFTEWLSLNYLDFQNESEQYKKSVTEEIKEKIKSYKK